VSLDSKDILKLGDWSFLDDYGRRREDLLELARAAYDATEFLQGYDPTPDDCEKLYMALLIGSEIFRAMLARKRHLQPSFYEAMCLALARYVLHTDWALICLTE
jgi:hypothetical protein